MKKKILKIMKKYMLKIMIISIGLAIAISGCKSSSSGNGPDEPGVTLIVVTTTVDGSSGTPGQEVNVVIGGTADYDVNTTSGNVTQEVSAGTYNVACGSVPGYLAGGSIVNQELAEGDMINVTCSYITILENSINVSTTVDGSSGTPGQEINVVISGDADYDLNTSSGIVSQVTTAGTYSVTCGAVDGYTLEGSVVDQVIDDNGTIDGNGTINVTCEYTRIPDNGTINVTTTVNGVTGTPDQEIDVVISGDADFDLNTTSGTVSQETDPGTYSVACSEVQGYTVSGSVVDQVLAEDGSLNVTCAYSAGAINVSTTVNGVPGTPGQEINVIISGTADYDLNTSSGNVVQETGTGTYSVACDPNIVGYTVSGSIFDQVLAEDGSLNVTCAYITTTTGTINVNTTYDGVPGTPGREISVSIQGPPSFNLTTDENGTLSKITNSGIYNIVCEDVLFYEVTNPSVQVLNADGEVNVTCAYVNGTASFSEDFDSYNDGDNVTGWTTRNIQGSIVPVTFTASTTTPLGGTGLCGDVHNYDGAWAVGADLSLDNLKPRYVKVWIRTVSGDGFFWLSSGETNFIYVRYLNSWGYPPWFYNIGSTYFSAPTKPSGWFKIEIMDIDWINYTYDVYMDDVLIGEDKEFEPMIGIDTITVGGGRSGASSTYFDDIEIWE
ncbi:hypothetical protein ACFL20_04215 [Spirochaetota bacterium]